MRILPTSENETIDRKLWPQEGKYEKLWGALESPNDGHESDSSKGSKSNDRYMGRSREAIEEAEEKDKELDLIVDPFPSKQEDGSLLEPPKPTEWAESEGEERHIDFIQKGYRKVWVVPLVKRKDLQLKKSEMEITKMEGPAVAQFETQEKLKTIRLKGPMQYPKDEKQWETWCRYKNSLLNVPVAYRACGWMVVRRKGEHFVLGYIKIKEEEGQKLIDTA